MSPTTDPDRQLLVVGGGIVGAGIAREAALRGLRVLLVEQGDLASGTSSRSSRLLHGGIRYLAQGHLGLVREASHEKRILQRIAPHLAEPLAFLFPTRRGTQWSKWKLRFGVKLYDWLAAGNLGRSSVLSSTETLQRLPMLSPNLLTGAVRYYDGFTCDARLVLDTLRSAAQRGAAIRNYTQLAQAERLNDRWHCLLDDLRTRQRYEVVSQSVINATGPWSDRIPHSHTKLRLTKGVHLVVDRARLPVPDAVVMSDAARILFAIPWGERVILGTTDTDYDGPLDAPQCEPEDLQTILKVTATHFPGANLTAADVISTWAGLRPLVADSHGRPSDISRHHEILTGEPGWFDITGGKLTTYRLMAEQLVDRVVAQLGVAATRSSTAHEPLLSPDQTVDVSGVLPPPITQNAVEHYCRQEWAEHLDDIMIRRTSWRYYHREHHQIAERVLGWMADSLGWDATRAERERQRYAQLTAEPVLGKA